MNIKNKSSMCVCHNDIGIKNFLDDIDWIYNSLSIVVVTLSAPGDFFIFNVVIHLQIPI